MGVGEWGWKGSGVGGWGEWMAGDKALKLGTQIKLIVNEGGISIKERK